MRLAAIVLYTLYNIKIIDGIPINYFIILCDKYRLFATDTWDTT